MKNKNKAICTILLVIVLAITLYSMQMCEFFTGIREIAVDILTLSDTNYISDYNITVAGTVMAISDDQKSVHVWCQENPDILTFTDDEVSDGEFSGILTFNSSMKSGLYILNAQATDSKGNVSLVRSIKINFLNPSNNIIFNNKFENFIDNYSGTYSSETDLTDYLNDQNDGDYLADWTFFIPIDLAKLNKQKLDISSGNIHSYSTAYDSNGNLKFEARQNLTHTVTDKTKIYIKFKINDFSGGSVPDEAPVRIGITTDEMDYRGTAAFSTGGGTGNGINRISGLIPAEEYEYDFYLTAPDVIAGGSYTKIGSGEIIQSIRIWINCHSWDVEIYEIRLYEGA